MTGKDLVALFMVTLMIVLGLVLYFVDETQDVEGEQICMSQVGELEYEGWQPECDL